MFFDQGPNVPWSRHGVPEKLVCLRYRQCRPDPIDHTVPHQQTITYPESSKNELREPHKRNWRDFQRRGAESNRWIAGRLGLSEKAVRKSLPRLGWKPGPDASLSFLPEAGHTAIAYIDGRTSTDSGFEIAEEKSRMEIDKATSRIRLAQEVLDEVFGLGPLEPLLADPTISDILVNTYKHVYIERKGMLEATTVQFRDDI